MMTLGSAIYNSGASLIRYWFVKTSLRANIQENFKREKFINICKYLPQVSEDFINNKQVMLKSRDK